MEQNEFTKATIFNLREAVVYAGHAIVSKTILKKNAGNISLFAFYKNEGLSEHTSPFDAMIYLMEGSALITIGENQLTLKSGEMIILPAKIPHSVKALENFKMMLVMIRTVDSKFQGSK